MKRKLIFILSLFIFALASFSQAETHNQTATTPPADGKFEIITSPIAMKITFLLNKCTGETWELTESSDGSYYWNKLLKLDNDDGKKVSSEKPCYQIVTSGVAVRGTYLVNTLTGETWMLYEDSYADFRYWKSMGLPN